MKTLNDDLIQQAIKDIESKDPYKLCSVCQMPLILDNHGGLVFTWGKNGHSIAPNRPDMPLIFFAKPTDQHRMKYFTDYMRESKPICTDCYQPMQDIHNTESVDNASKIINSLSNMGCMPSFSDLEHIFEHGEWKVDQIPPKEPSLGVALRRLADFWSKITDSEEEFPEK